MAGRSKERRPKAEVPEYLENFTAADALDVIMKMDGAPGDTYNRYGITLSAMNMGRLAAQGLFEFGNTLPRWNNDFNRAVIVGQRAHYIARPKFERERDPVTGKMKDTDRYIGSYLVKCWFGVNQTHGDDMPPWETPEYSVSQLLAKHGVEEERFVHDDGNVQGYSYDKKIAVNPIARWPDKTRLHEMGHYLRGDTAPEYAGIYADRAHRGRSEWVVETAAHIALKLAGAASFLMNEQESVHYGQTWYDGEAIREEDRTQAVSIGQKLFDGMLVPKPQEQELEAAV